MKNQDGETMQIEWRTARPMPVLVKGGAMGMVDGAPVYAAGCTYPWRETEQAWYWDVEQGDWYPADAFLPLGRCYTHGVTLHDGLLLLGGRKSTATGRVSLRDAWWLRRQNGTFTWTQLPDMNNSRAIPSIGSAGNRILAFGGGEWERSQGGAFTTRHLTHYETLDLDDLDTGWRDRGPLPFPSLVGSAFASVHGSVYVFGGYECWTDEENQRQIRRYGTAWRYDFGDDTWTQLADFPGVGSGWAALPYGRTILLLGGGVSLDVDGVQVPQFSISTREPGTSRQRPIGAYSDLVFVYNTADDTYHLLADRLPLGANDLRCTISGDTIYVAGGETIDPPLSNCTDVFLIGKISL